MWAAVTSHWSRSVSVSGTAFTVDFAQSIQPSMMRPVTVSVTRARGCWSPVPQEPLISGRTGGLYHPRPW